MKNFEIFNLVNCEVLAITANELESAHAYKVVKFKRAIRKAFEAISEAEKDFLKEAGIEDAQAFDTERAELIKTNSDPDRLTELNKQFDRFNELRQTMLNEESELDIPARLPFDQFHLLQKENKDLKFKPLNTFEDILEGVLWNAPETEE